MGAEISKIIAEPLMRCSHDYAYYVLNGCNSECETPCVRCKFANPREEEEEDVVINEPP